MSLSNPNNLRLSNEQLLLVSILNTMYNDNLSQINSITNTLNRLNNSNELIRNILIEILDLNLGSNLNNINNNIGRRNRSGERRMWNNINNNQLSSLSSLFFDTQPYTVSETLYTIPLRQTGSTNRSNRNGNQNINDNTLTQLLQSFLQPIEVYPTQSQIETATRHVRYSDITRPINTECPISMDDFTDNDMVTVIRQCGHIFHTENLMNWFRSNCRCPVCRYDIRDYNSNASTEFFTNNQRTSNSNVDPSGNNISMSDEFVTSYLNRTLGRYRNSR